MYIPPHVFSLLKPSLSLCYLVEPATEGAGRLLVAFLPVALRRPIFSRVYHNVRLPRVLFRDVCHVILGAWCIGL